MKRGAVRPPAPPHHAFKDGGDGVRPEGTAQPPRRETVEGAVHMARWAGRVPILGGKPPSPPGRAIARLTGRLAPRVQSRGLRGGIGHDRGRG